MQSLAASLAPVMGPAESVTKTMAEQFGAESLARAMGPSESLARLVSLPEPVTKSRGTSKRSRGKRNRRTKERHTSDNKGRKGTNSAQLTMKVRYLSHEWGRQRITQLSREQLDLSS